MGDPPYKVPSMSTLLAFEAVARLGVIARAAKERNTSQSAISRHIRNLETILDAKLFRRSGRGISLTGTGEDYYAVVQESMDVLHAAGRRICAHKTELTIGCTLEISGLLMLPVFTRLKRHLGDDVAARIVIYDHETLPMLQPAGLDIIFEELATDHPDPGAVRMLAGEIVPVASPAVLEQFRTVLAKHPCDWSGVPRLDLGRQCLEGASWETWFYAHRCSSPDAPVETYENYFHLLRAAADGDGIAVGRNGFINDYVRAGELVPVRDEWLRTKIAMYGLPTSSGRRNSLSRVCLQELSRLVKQLTTRRPGETAESGSQRNGVETAA